MVQLGVVIGKCEMSSTHISQENKHAIARGQMSIYVVHLQINSSGIKLHFSLNLLNRNIIKSYLNIYSLFCVQ